MGTLANIRKKKKYAIIFLLLSLHTFFFLPLRPLLAQTSIKVDRLPPEIQHRRILTTLDLEDPVILQATIKDNQMLREVRLFYRTTGKKDYASLRMERINNTEYLTIIPQRFIFGPGIEYYIQASDTAGNTSTQGTPNAPLIIKFKTPIAQTEQNTKANSPDFPMRKGSFRLRSASTATEETNRKAKPWYKKWWVWSIAIGVVAGGVAAAGSSGNTTPTTGTGTVSAEIP